MPKHEHRIYLSKRVMKKFNDSFHHDDLGKGKDDIVVREEPDGRVSFQINCFTNALMKAAMVSFGFTGTPEEFIDVSLDMFDAHQRMEKYRANHLSLDPRLN